MQKFIRSDLPAPYYTTPADLLRYHLARTACRKCAEAGKAFSAEAQQYAARPVVRQAVALLSARAARREAAKRPPTPKPNRFAEAAANRREKAVADAVEGAVRQCNYRHARAGDHAIVVRLGDAGCHGESSQGDRYSSTCTFRKTDSCHRFTVPAAWLATVYDRNLEVVNGKLTLAAESVPGYSGVELYAAVWVEQGKGFSLKAERGFIADFGNKAYHGATANAALRRCRNFVTAQIVD